MCYLFHADSHLFSITFITGNDDKCKDLLWIRNKIRIVVNGYAITKSLGSYMLSNPNYAIHLLIRLIFSRTSESFFQCHLSPPYIIFPYYLPASLSLCFLWQFLFLRFLLLSFLLWQLLGNSLMNSSEEAKAERRRGFAWIKRWSRRREIQRSEM